MDMEEVVHEDPLVDLGIGGMFSKHEEGGAGAGAGARAFETSSAEALHERDRNSIGALGLSGN